VYAADFVDFGIFTGPVAVVDLEGAEPALSPLGDGLTPSLTSMLANATFYRSTVKHATQKNPK